MMLARLYQLLRGEEAATSVEYAVMLAMIILACIGAILVVGQNTAAMWQETADELDAAGL